MNKFYILIDKLDDRWVDVSIRFRLIRALIESLKAFRRITNLKILAAVRSDILERVVQETGDLTFQREKFEDYFVHLRWTKPLLKELLQKRVRELFRRQYTQREISFEDVFPYKVGNVEPFDYIIERTLMRPRDLIAFVNECLREANDSYEVTATAIRRAEIEFSRIRRDALVQEWQSAFPTISLLLDFVSEPAKVIVEFEELATNPRFEDFALSLYGAAKIDYDPVYQFAHAYVDDKDNNPLPLLRAIAGALYRAGAIGVKLKNAERYLYSHIDHPILSSPQMTMESRIRIHPMLWGAFRLQ